jgi:hypothetical protein
MNVREIAEDGEEEETNRREREEERRSRRKQNDFLPIKFRMNIENE